MASERSPKAGIRSWVRLIIMAAALALPACAAPWLVSKTFALYPHAASHHAYFVAQHALLLYVAMPLAVLSSFVCFLLPGTFGVLLLGSARRLEELLLFGFAGSLGLCALLGTAAKLALGLPLGRFAFFLLWVATAILLATLLIARARKHPPVMPWMRAGDRRRLAQIAAFMWLAVALLVPKIFWENFNVDGVEAFEFGRSLTWHLFPSWAVQDGVFGLYHNFVLFAYPNHWFISLLGPLEAAARLPFVLYVGLLFAALALLVEHASARPLAPAEEGVLWLALALYTVVQAYNTNYDPFFADLAETAATDTLWVLCFLAALYALWANRAGWFSAFALMNYLASPGAAMLLAALGALTFIAPVPERGRQLKQVVTVLVICAVVGIAYELLYVPNVFGRMIANQFSSVSMLRRLFPPTLTEVVRFNALLFTTGLLPALALGVALARRRKDPFAFVAAGVTLAFFAALYIQPWTSLHQFTPVMLLPLVVFWRLYLSLNARWQRGVLPACALATVACLLLSLPLHFQVNLAARELGMATYFRVGDAGVGYSRATQAGWTAGVLVPEGYRLEYPNQPWGTDAYTFLYYALRPEKKTINYVVQPATSPAPPGFTNLETRDGIALFLRDARVWQSQRKPEFPRVVISPLYDPILRQSYAFFRSYTSAQRR
jgi:hypothetical protein